jgi:hypothetical protein
MEGKSFNEDPDTGSFTCTLSASEMDGLGYEQKDIKDERDSFADLVQVFGWQTPMWAISEQPFFLPAHIETHFEKVLVQLSQVLSPSKVIKDSTGNDYYTCKIHPYWPLNATLREAFRCYQNITICQGSAVGENIRVSIWTTSHFPASSVFTEFGFKFHAVQFRMDVESSCL